MIDSGKWGREVTTQIGPATSIIGSRGRERVTMVSKETLLAEPAQIEANLKSGDIVFFIKDPGKRVSGEIVGHIGIITRGGNADYLIHAAGRKGRGGVVKKVLFSEYLISMPFVGIRVSRFD